MRTVSVSPSSFFESEFVSASSLLVHSGLSVSLSRSAYSCLPFSSPTLSVTWTPLSKCGRRLRYVSVLRGLYDRSR